MNEAQYPRRLLFILPISILSFMIAIGSIGGVLFLRDVPMASASQACPFTVDGDGGTPGIQVTSNITVPAVAGDFYACTGLIEIVSPTVVTLGTDTSSGAIAEIHFVDLKIDSGATMESDARGCAASLAVSRGPTSSSSNVCTPGGLGAGGNNTGSFTGDGGGAHGTAGGNGTTMAGGAPYDAPTAPVLFGASGGSGDGGAGGSGGGAIRLDISGTFTHNGFLSANGTAGVVGAYGQGPGGGAGGSIYVTVGPSGNVTGTTGTYSATGGNGGASTGNGGGGGGGRVAVTYYSGDFPFADSRFTMSGGSASGSAQAGDNGTVYTKNLTSAAVTIFSGYSYDDTDYSETSWTVDAGASNQYCIPGTTTPSVTATTISISGIQTCTTLGAGDAFSYSSSGAMNITSFTYASPVQTYFNITGGAAVTLTGTAPLPTVITANTNWTSLGSLNIDSHSTINADGRGCVAVSAATSYGPNGANVCVSGGTGAGGSLTPSNTGGGGAAHGGAGGNGNAHTNGAATFDSSTNPVFFGASGGSLDGAGALGGAGGGLIAISVTGVVTIHGILTANGLDGFGSSTYNQGSGGGSGGSINLTSGGLMGGSTSTQFSAIGGNGGVYGAGKGGGGGGGRIAILHAGGSFPFSAARFNMNGGAATSPATAGGKGTVYVKNTSTNAVTIYHGFSFDSTYDSSAHYSATSWTVEASATNVYCVTGTATPSVTATTISISGSQDCSSLGAGQAFSYVASGSVTLSGFTYTGLPQTFFNISGGASVTLASTTHINANTHWVTIASLSIDTSSSINADGKGCVVPSGLTSYGPTGLYTCSSGGNGAGGNTSASNGGDGGGGHGGAGGDGSFGAVGGTAGYDSSTAPVLFGATGGSSDGAGALGGSGGGVVRIDMTAAMVMNGSITASGLDGFGSPTYNQGSGGGAGGSIYVTIGGIYSCPLATPTWRAVGGIGGATVGGKGGGGGGGIISITTATDTCSAPLSGLLASTVVAGGSATSSAMPGGDGLYNAVLTGPFVSTPTLSNTMNFSRLQASASSSFAVSFALQGTRSGVLTVTFPVGFTVTAMTGAGSSGCLGTFGHTSSTVYATKSSCSGTITLAGATVTNPSSPGSYLVTWVNDDPGSAIVAIVDSDQVSMSASVDPFITVNVGSQASATACDGTFAGAGGAFALGALSTGSVTSSDASSVPHICLRVSTNASSGAVATVKSLNGNLKSTSTPADTIPSNSVTLSAGTAGYGLCVGSGGGDTGLDTTTPAGAAPARTSPFDGSCTSSAHAIGALTTGAQSIFILAGPTQNAFARIYLKAGISTSTKAHLDYADTLTFIVTGTF